MMETEDQGDGGLIRAVVRKRELIAVAVSIEKNKERE